jgi:hypothetical protein
VQCVFQLIPDDLADWGSYAAQPAALALNLTYATRQSAIIRVDTSDTDASTGRISVRLESKTTYNSGLFVFDILHTPVGCATWPALWLTDPYNWPEHGEIDVMESVNLATTGNQVTLHTGAGCKMDVKRKHTGKALQDDCHNITNANAGCGVQGPVTSSGTLFNEHGGVYVLEWRSQGIRVWFFPRSTLPPDLAFITSEHTLPAPPNLNSWPLPIADFPNTHCDPGHFGNMSIIINTDIGGMAGSDESWVKDGCVGDRMSGVEYVSGAPGRAWEEAYWEVGGIWVFQAQAEGGGEG